MAWRIFKKDLILLWPLALLCILAEAGLAALMFASDSEPEAQVLLLAARLSVAVVFLAVVFTTAFAVQQEPIPGTRQDWLVRPVRRLDLLLAKLLFVALVVHLPLFLCDLIGAMARGFSLAEAAGPALVHNFNVFLMLTVPALGFAAMTRTVAGFLIAGLAYFVASIAATILLNLIARIGGQEQVTNPIFWTGVAWIPQTLQRFALAAGAVVALALLYSRRKVMLARSIFPVFAVVSAVAVLMPWTAIFAVQQAAEAPVSPTVRVSFDLQAPRYRLAAGELTDAYVVGAAQVQLRGRDSEDIAAENQKRRARGDVTVFVPLRLAGTPGNALLWADRAAVRLVDQSGRVVFQGRGDDMKRDGAGRAYEAIRIPALVYEANRDHPLDLAIDYSLSVLEPLPPQSAPALGADLRLTSFGRCTTDRDSDGDEIALRCIKPGRSPSCVSTRLEDPASGRRNPETLLCSPDYAPYVLKPFPDALSRFEVETPFRDRLGLASYPVGEGQLGTARVVVTRYEAQAHLAPRVSARGVRLADWTPSAAGQTLRP
jgi:hypothetical protein